MGRRNWLGQIKFECKISVHLSAVCVRRSILRMSDMLLVLVIVIVIVSHRQAAASHNIFAVDEIFFLDATAFKTFFSSVGVCTVFPFIFPHISTWIRAQRGMPGEREWSSNNIYWHWHSLILSAHHLSSTHWGRTERIANNNNELKRNEISWKGILPRTQNAHHHNTTHINWN